MSVATRARRPARLRMRHLVPLGVFAGLVVALGVGLGLNPRLVPSPLVGKPVPAFSLPRLGETRETLGREDLRGQASLVNFWAVWCAGCRDEHGLLLDIARGGEVPIYGVNWKDQYEPALAWLARLGNPYEATGYDGDGRVGVDFGVYGLPETYVVDAGGTIRHKHTGPLTVRAWREEIRPLLATLEDESR